MAQSRRAWLLCWNELLGWGEGGHGEENPGLGATKTSVGVTLAPTPTPVPRLHEETRREGGRRQLCCRDEGEREPEATAGVPKGPHRWAQPWKVREAGGAQS